MGENDKTLSVLAHVLGIITGFIGALIIFFVAKDDETKKHAKEALNWQISVTIYFIIAGILMLVLIGLILMPILGILNLIFCIMGAVKAANGEFYRYPITIRLVK